MIRAGMLSKKWPLVELGSVVEFLDSQRRPITAKDRVAGPYPYYGANGQQDSVDSYIFDESLILLAEDGGNFGDPNRCIAYQVDGKCWVNNHAHVLRPKDSVDIRYLLRQLEKYDVTPLITGATRAKLNKSAALKILISLPPLEEQKRIATILDKADAIRRKRQQSIELADQFLRSVFLDMFGDPVTNARGWAVVPMADIFSVSPNYGTMNPPDDVKGKYLDLRVANIQGNKLDLRTKKYVDLDDKMVVKHEVMQGDIMLARAIGSKHHLGKCIVAAPPHDERWAFDSHLMRIRVKKEIIFPEFVQAYLDSSGGRYEFMKHTRRSAVQYNINTKEIAKVNIFLPPMKHQRRYLELIKSVDEKVKTLKQAQQRSSELFGVIAQQAFNGNLMRNRAA